MWRVQGSAHTVRTRIGNLELLFFHSLMSVLPSRRVLATVGAVAAVGGAVYLYLRWSKVWCHKQCGL